MAKCKSCGKWAGFFSKECAACSMKGFVVSFPALPAAEPEASVAPIASPVAGVGPHSAMPLNFTTENHGLAQQHLDEVQREVAGVKTVGVVLRRTGPFAERLNRSIPQLQMIVGRELRRNRIDDLWTCPKVTAKLLDPATLAAGENDFHRWRRSDDAPDAMRMFDQDRASALFWAAWALDASANHLESQLGDGLDGVFPYFRLDAFACPLPTHAAMDGFTAKRDDPIWEAIWPPNGWLCACTVFPILVEDADAATDAKAGIGRIESSVWIGCAEWYTRSPRSALKRRRIG